MANPFNIQEVTLAQLADSTHAINTVDTTGLVSASPRKWVYQPIVAIVTDHEDTTSNLADWPDGGGTPTDTPANVDHMEQTIAVFLQRRHGEQWEKQYGHKKHVIAKGSRGSSGVVTPVFTTGVLTGFTVGTPGTGYAPKEHVVVTGGTSTVDGVGVIGTVGSNGEILTVEVYQTGTYTVDGTGTNLDFVPVDVTNLYADFDYSTFE